MTNTSMADRVALMERGEIALVDSSDVVADDEHVKRRYLGCRLSEEA